MAQVTFPDISELCIGVPPSYNRITAQDTITITKDGMLGDVIYGDYNRRTHYVPEPVHHPHDNFSMVIPNSVSESYGEYIDDNGVYQTLSDTQLQRLTTIIDNRQVFSSSGIAEYGFSYKGLTVHCNGKDVYHTLSIETGSVIFNGYRAIRPNNILTVGKVTPAIVDQWIDLLEEVVGLFGKVTEYINSLTIPYTAEEIVESDRLYQERRERILRKFNNNSIYGMSGVNPVAVNTDGDPIPTPPTEATRKRVIIVGGFPAGTRGR